MTMHAADLGATLRAWRDRTSPRAAGLPSGRARRASGLRREELAELTGISVDYVVRLEQGRSTTPSAQVIAALARALQLTGAERDHLYRLAGLAPPGNGEISDHIPPGVQRVLNRLGGGAVAVFAADWQLIWFNQGWAALLGNPASSPPELRNFARDSFPVDGYGPRMHQWSVRTHAPAMTEAAIVSDLRRASGRFPDDKRLSDLIQLLNEGSQRFAELWKAGGVSAHREDHKVVEHPVVGPIEVDCDVLTDGDAELKIVIMTAALGSEDEAKLRQAMLSDIPAPTGAATTARFRHEDHRGSVRNH